MSRTSAKTLASNTTQTSIANETDPLESVNFAEFKERYRRLIPYMTYYVANNYVNSQVLSGAQAQDGYDKEALLPVSQFPRKPQRSVLFRRPSDPRRKFNGRVTSNVGRGTSHKQEAKFVPSVQYDPRDIGTETDYFAPVRYNPKLNYDTLEYSGLKMASEYAEYERPQRRPPLVRSKLMSSPDGISHHDTRYYINDGPSSRPLNPHYERKYLPHRSNVPVADQHQDYLLDYGAKMFNDEGSAGGKDFNYPPDNSELVNIERPSWNRPKPTRILAQSSSAQSLLHEPSSIYSTVNNPTASLDDITKSLQLTNRLPEMLNRDNVDISIKTLLEILGILNNSKRTNFQRSPIKSAHLHENRLRIHDGFKQPHARPRVVTETRFQATPRPPAIPEDETIRYETETTYGTNVEQKIPINVNYESVNNDKYENVVNYYTPLNQDIEEEKIDMRYGPTERPVKEHFENKYEISEDPRDTLADQEAEKYALPMTTETPISEFRLPDGASGNRQLVPPTTLKYGATRGKPNVDYPAHAAIPETKFNCKEQRYKGFFGDPSTGCQVWHYCDLNGGKSSFLCPNGTIFSQVALTCDWWFNVKCESTPQLYVLNERLYKYILPVKPKFPEDFSGPEVDRYLELKFMEMEAKLKEKKLTKEREEQEKIKEKLQDLDNEAP